MLLQTVVKNYLNRDLANKLEKEMLREHDKDLNIRINIRSYDYKENSYTVDLHITSEEWGEDVEEIFKDVALYDIEIDISNYAEKLNRSIENIIEHE